MSWQGQQVGNLATPAHHHEALRRIPQEAQRGHRLEEGENRETGEGGWNDYFDSDRS